MVDEHAHAAAHPGPEAVELLVEVVDALEVLDDDALDPEVLAPHLLHELGVVPALHEDPAGQGDAGLPVGDRERSGRGARRACGRGTRDAEGHGLALEQEGPAERERALLPAEVLEHDHPGLDAHDRTAEPGRQLLDY